MKIKRYILSLIILLCAMSIQATNPQSGVHIFGFATSFTDSTIYITEIQYLDSAYIEKHHFLLGREQYSYQLQNYLSTKGIKIHPTCVTFFAQEKDQIEKKYLTLRKKYEKAGKFIIKVIPLKDFIYHPIPLQAENNM